MGVPDVIRRTPHSPQDHDVLAVVFQVTAFVAVDVQLLVHGVIPGSCCGRGGGSSTDGLRHRNSSLGDN
jgi:hypothetical protein